MMRNVAPTISRKAMIGLTDSQMLNCYWNLEIRLISVLVLPPCRFEEGVGDGLSKVS